MILNDFLPFDRFFGGAGLWMLWAVGNLIVGVGVLVIAIVGALIIRGLRFLLGR